MQGGLGVWGALQEQVEKGGVSYLDGKSVVQAVSLIGRSSINADSMLREMVQQHRVGRNGDLSKEEISEEDVRQ